MAAITDEQKRAAFYPCPKMALPDDIIFDALSLTSFRSQLPGRPAVAPYLHGLVGEPPETFVAWRREVSLLAEAGEEAVTKWFQVCGLKSRELLRGPSANVFKELEKIAKRTRRLPIVLINERGDARWCWLSDLKEEEAIQYCTVVLPVEAGGCNQGFLDGAYEAMAADVAMEDDAHRRMHFSFADDYFQARNLGSEDMQEQGECDSLREALEQVAKGMAAEPVCVSESVHEALHLG